MGDPPDDALRFGRAYEGFAAPATHTTSHLVMRRLQSTLAHRSHPKSLPPRIFFLIPANMTWALQPCDTHVMARYKRQLRLEFQNRQMAAPHGTVPIPAVVECACAAIRRVLQGLPWAKAFADNGLVQSQLRLSTSVLHTFGWAQPPTVSANLPSLQQLQHIFPGRCDIPIEGLFGIFRTMVPRTSQHMLHMPHDDTGMRPRDQPGICRPQSSQSALEHPPLPPPLQCPGASASPDHLRTAQQPLVLRSRLPRAPPNARPWSSQSAPTEAPASL